MINWFTRGLAWLSQGFNWLFLNGNHDQTVSARCYVNRDKSPWKCLYITINTLVFWQDNHCKSSFDRDVEFALEIIQYQNK